jgi:transcriptional regulator with XRE-family HTH domain
MPPTKPSGTARYINGGTVRRLREAYGIPQQKLALDCGVHPAYVSNIEAGRKQPSPELMRKIADRLGVNLDDISYVIVSDGAA